jgi:hypothetical protein
VFAYQTKRGSTVTSWGESTNESWAETDVLIDYGYAEVKKPPKWPLAVQVSLILFSAFLYLAGPLLFLTQRLAISVIGYLLTPFLVVFFLAVLRTKDLRNRSLPWYDRGLGKVYLAWSRRLCLISFVIAIPILWTLAVEIVN